ncbi:MAG: hypothetical protein QXF43_04180 [Nitrososphaerales archaeon]
MIKITKVERTMGETKITFQYDKDENIFTQTVDESEIIERMKELKKIVGRRLTQQDLKDVIIALINEIREGKSVLLEKFPYENLIGVDLE